MIILDKTGYQQAAELLKEEEVGVIPTDTIYGISCVARSEEAVSRLYNLKKRKKNSPFIILISDLTNLTEFGVSVEPAVEETLMEFWPGPNSIILPCNEDNLEYLHCGTNSLAFRMPESENNAALVNLLKETGPLVSTSANKSTYSPAVSIEEAVAYFGDDMDFYLDVGYLNKQPSSLLQIIGNTVIYIRK